MSLDAAATMDASLIPPVEMRFDGSSSVEQFVAFGEGFVRHILIPRAGLLPSDVFLDLGCGNGLVARALTSYLQPPGRYEGLDINGDSVKWLREHYAAWPAFRFTHANVFNKMYNPGATFTAAEYRLPYEDGTFTQALLKSVFTHMHPRDMRHYLRELGRVIKPGGRAVITYFLLNDESRAFVANDLDVIKMKLDWDGDPLCRVANLEVPEHATAHDEARVRAYTAEAGFSVSEVTFGNWCGRPGGGLQDVMVLTRTQATSAPGSLSARIGEYERSLSDHRAGTVDTSVLHAIERFAPPTVNSSMETGCGKTTILLSNLSAHHHVFAFDDRAEERSSIRYYEDCPLFKPECTTEVLGATQLTLPVYQFTEPIDLALLDGPHGYPFPELEYYYVYPKLRPGPLLVIDDIHIPTIHRLHTFLAEDEMFDLVHIERTTSFFVRTSTPTFFPLGDGWEHQAFNKARFPAYPPPYTPPPAAVPLQPDPLVPQLRQRVAELESQLAHWQHVAEERRLKRRLARRLGDWPFLR